MKELTFQKLMLLSSVFGGVLLHIDVSETINFIAKNISFISFIVILVSNWHRFVKQVKYWLSFRDDKRSKK
jgi:hypothetical protein